MKRSFLLLLFLLVSILGYGQLGTPTIKTPSISSLEKFVDYPVDESTGLTKISILLFELKLGNRNIPISISYHPSGIRLNQLESNVGLGWSLQGLPFLSRNVMGVPDEKPTVGNLYTLPVDEATVYQRINSIAPYTNKLENFSYLENLTKNISYDVSPDIFSYSLLDASGKFFFDAQRKYETIPFEPLKIVHFLNTSGALKYRYEITDKNGIYFNFDQPTYTTSETGNPPFGLFNLSSISGWNVSKILDKTNRDSIVFNYENINQSETIYADQQQIGKEPVSSGTTSGPAFSRVLQDMSSVITNQNYTLSHSENQLKKIQHALGYCDFYYSGYFLDRIICYNLNNLVVKTIKFIYNHSDPNRTRVMLDAVEFVDATSIAQRYDLVYNALKFPSRNGLGVYSQDIFGYYNGASNIGLIPRDTVDGTQINSNGLSSYNRLWHVGNANRNFDTQFMQASILKSIKSPTKGVTQFSFSPNIINTTKNIVSQKSIGGRIDGKGRLIKSEGSYILKHVENTDENFSATLSITFSPPVPITPVVIEDDIYTQNIFIIDKSNNQIIFSKHHDGNPQVPLNFSSNLVLKKNRTYELKVIVYGDKNVVTSGGYPATFAEARISWTEQSSKIVPTYVGGLKVDKIEIYEKENLLTSTSFEYSNPYYIFENSLLNKNFDDYAFYSPEQGSVTSTTYFRFYQRSYRGISSYSAIGLNSNNVIYQKVKKYVTGFNTQSDTIINNYVTAHEELSSALLSKFANSSNYTQFSPPWSFTSTVSEAVINSVNQFKKKVSRGYTNVFLRNNLGYQLYIRPNVIYRHDDISVAIYPSDVLSISNFEVFKKTLTSANFLPTSEITEQDNIITEKEYSYSLNNLEYSQIRQKNSLGKINLTKLLYPADITSTQLTGGNISNAEFTAINNLNKENLHKVSTVIQKENYNDLSLIDIERTSFTNIGGLTYPYLLSRKIGNSDLIKELEISKHDGYGNPLEIKKQENPPTAYLWGYGGQYPIAEIKNATYADVLAVLTQTTINSLNAVDVTETTINNAMSALRNHVSLNKAMVTSYTYKPLVGMTSKTDSRGVTEYYEYDGMQRLKAVLDQMKNVTSSMDYHYRPN